MMKEFFRKIGLRILNVVTPARLGIAILFSFFFWFLAFGDQGLYQLKELMEMRSKLAFDQKKLNEEIDTITKEREILSDPKNLEMVIRNELGYIKPGEVVFEEKRIEKPAAAPVKGNAPEPKSAE